MSVLWSLKIEVDACCRAVQNITFSATHIYCYSVACGGRLLPAGLGNNIYVGVDAVSAMDASIIMSTALAKLRRLLLPTTQDWLPLWQACV